MISGLEPIGCKKPSVSEQLVTCIADGEMLCLFNIISPSDLLKFLKNEAADWKIRLESISDWGMDA